MFGIDTRTKRQKQLQKEMKTIQDEKKREEEEKKEKAEIEMAYQRKRAEMELNIRQQKQTILNRRHEECEQKNSVAKWETCKEAERPFATMRTEYGILHDGQIYSILKYKCNLTNRICSITNNPTGCTTCKLPHIPKELFDENMTETTSEW